MKFLLGLASQQSALRHFAFEAPQMSAHSKGPTLDQLHSAWLRRNQKGKLWPPSFEEAMAHPLLSRILKIRALHIDLRDWVRREVKPPDFAITSPVAFALGARARASKPHPEPDRRAYWMDSDQDLDDLSDSVRD